MLPKQVGFYNCWYFYALIGIGNWLLLRKAAYPLCC